MAAPGIKVLSKEEICGLISNADALDAVEVAYVSLANDPERTGKSCYGPANGMINFGDARKEFHIKGAGNQGNAVFVIKMASAFYDNPEKFNMPSGNGMVLVFCAERGVPLAVLQDGGHLTDLRTGAAAAVMAAKLQVKSPEKVNLGVVGAGIMSHLVIDMYFGLIGHAKYPAREVQNIIIWARNAAKAEAFAVEVAQKYGAQINVIVETTPDDVAAKSEVLFTCTPSREPLLTQKLRPGTVCVALGSDQPGKRELGDAILNGDNVFIVCDDIHHCFEAGESEFLPAERKASRSRMCHSGDVFQTPDFRDGNNERVYICDHTGVGTQDAAIADKLWQRVCASEGKN